MLVAVIAVATDVTDIGDLTYLINFLFITGVVPVCPEEADLDRVPGIDIGDLTVMIDYLFITGTLPGPCP